MSFDPNLHETARITNPLQIVALNAVLSVLCISIGRYAGVGWVTAIFAGLMAGPAITLGIVGLLYSIAERRVRSEFETSDATGATQTPALRHEIWKWTEDAADDAWVATRIKAKVAAEMARAEADARAERRH